MRRAAALVFVCFFATSALAFAQPSEPKRLVGNMLGGHLQMRNGRTIATATLWFGDPDEARRFSVDFVCKYEGPQQTTPPTVVDIIVTEHLAFEEKPEMTMRVDGQPLPLIARPRTPRTIVSSISFDEFVKLTEANTLIEHAFDTDLEFGRGQLLMLRATAQRWAGR